jgi:hypothetical protein
VPLSAHKEPIGAILRCKATGVFNPIEQKTIRRINPHYGQLRYHFKIIPANIFSYTTMPMRTLKE